jgi:serine phosphatase RsbU (regulator of sigma subunit)
MQQVGGDFYDVELVDETTVFAIVADVSGHGVPAALVATMVKMGVVSQREHMRSPARVLANLNQMLCGQFDGAFVTAVCATIDASTGVLTYASAGHPAPLLVRADGRIEALEGSGLLLTFLPSAEYADTEVTIASGDRLVLYSDGITEAEGPGGEFFEGKRLDDWLIAHRSLGAQALVDQLVLDLGAWTGQVDAFEDDVTVVAVGFSRFEEETTTGA